ncbi:MAG TPA: RraA family protein [Opitutaceae bacterium]|nr:RraA family protein [Opitutaceae bacterium]
MALPTAQLLKLRRWNTPTIANALEQITTADPIDLVNRDETHDYMPEMGVMVGFAMTAIISGGDPGPKREHPGNFARFREYLASRRGPKIVVVQDVDAPRCFGAIWGEVGATNARTLGCMGTITDGAIRDLDEMRAVGFKALARRLAVSHAHCWPLQWNVEVEVFGTKIRPGQLIHADKHGFIVIPNSAQPRLIEAARFMDDNECETVIEAGVMAAGAPGRSTLQAMNRAAARFSRQTRHKYGHGGEWR